MTKSHPELLTTAVEIRELADILRSHSIIAFDTEFIRETTFFPSIELIQVATNTESWLIDARIGKEVLQPIFDIFSLSSVIKVAHASQADQECLYTAFGVIASPTFDTALAASLCGYGDGIGLANLLKHVLDVRLKKGHARTNWAVRPLPSQLIEYAHADVEHLVLLGQKLLEELDRLKRRDWAFKLSSYWENKAIYESNPEAMAWKLAGGARLDKREYGGLIELLRWREARVRSLNVPRRWVADDSVLLDLARVSPKDLGHLSTFRGINKGELKKSGEAILGALRRGAERVDKKEITEFPKAEKHEAPRSDAEAQVVDLLRCYLGILADKHRIAVRYLVSSSEVLQLVRSGARRVQDLLDGAVLGEDAVKLIGDEVIAFLNGKRALSINGNRVEIVEVGGKSA